MYISNLYTGFESAVKKFLQEKCADGTIKNFTYEQVFELIQEELGL